MSRHTNFVADCINENSFERIVEVGVHEGQTAKHIKKACPSIQEYFMVDPWKEYSGEGSGSLSKVKQKNWNDIYKRVANHFQSDPRFSIMRMDSMAASSLFEENSLDFIFIDAVHEYEACKEDIKIWYPKVRIGGILSGDDFSDSYPGVKKAVQELFPTFGTSGGRVWYVKKGSLVEGGKPMLFQPQTDTLVNIINQGKYRKVAEIGVVEGYTSFHVSHQCASVVKYYMIDPWKVRTGDGTGKRASITQARWDKMYNDICVKFSVDNRFEIIRMGPAQAVKLFDPESLDVVFINSIHSYDIVKRDIKLWLPIVNIGGVLCGEAYVGRFPGVKRAVDEILGHRLEFWDEGKRVWIYRK